jgi:hypothetical protein
MPGTRIDLTVDLDSRTQIPCDHAKPLVEAVTQTELSRSKETMRGNPVRSCYRVMAASIDLMIWKKIWRHEYDCNKRLTNHSNGFPKQASMLLICQACRIPTSSSKNFLWTVFAYRENTARSRLERQLPFLH